ncbi:hypothetical protein H6G80_26910 [Nostoc sp. FACHB-87]|uniref:hypothetical protein n=1 Tax=Nostocales TaxID=1161 RepID=UPI001683D416|nr:MULTISPECIES: hypothetical protein [Nostocales]MBD2457689.1 hypothetical protein [Nostoc sp. FACHB-87]MBD2478848.1 hypothetical protein [Anabaena sp. FACHB-83]MBD2491673.1 hypothetical protein [Aulosira sp. FACHB-615]
MAADKQIIIRISEEKKEALMNKVKANDTSVSKLLMDFIDSYLAEKAETSVDPELLKLKSEVAEMKQQFMQWQQQQYELLGESAA